MRKITMSWTLSLLFCVSVPAQVIDRRPHTDTEKDFWVGKPGTDLHQAKQRSNILNKLLEMNRHKIEHAVICGTLESIEKYTKADGRFIPAYQDHEDTLHS